LNIAPAHLLHRLRRPSAGLLALLLLALLARGLIGPGFMPRLGAEGVSIVLCTPQGVKTVPGVAIHPAGDAQCVFGLALGMAGLPSVATDFSARPASAESAILVPGRISLAAVRPYSARGPPQFS